MRAEKKYISKEYIEWLNSSPFFILVDYQGLLVEQFQELRNRLQKSNSELHVVKNTIFRIAAKEAGMADLQGQLKGQLAVAIGEQDISTTAKVIKNFHAEFEKPKLVLGYLNDERLDAQQLAAIADLPSLEVLRGQLAGVIQAPATKLVRLLNTPGSQLARVLQARVDQES